MAIGVPFSPAAGVRDEPSQQIRRRTPTQQALQTLSLRLPKVLGSGIAPAALLQGQSAGPREGGAQARMAAIVRAMTGGGPSGSPRPGGTGGLPIPPPDVDPDRRRVRPQPRPYGGAQTSRPPSAGGSETQQTFGDKRGGGATIKFRDAPVDPATIGGGYVDSLPPGAPQIESWGPPPGAESNPYARNAMVPRFSTRR